MLANKFLRNIDTINAAKNTTDDSPTIMVPLPFKDQQSANSVKKQMQILSANIGVQIKPVFQNKKIGQILQLVYKFECDLCDADYVGYTPDTYTSALMNTNTLQSGGILSNTVYRGMIWLTSNFLFLRNEDQSLIVLFLRCYSLRN